MLTIVNKIYRKEVYILSDNVENYRTVLTLFYTLYSSDKLAPNKKMSLESFKKTSRKSPTS